MKKVGKDKIKLAERLKEEFDIVIDPYSIISCRSSSYLKGGSCVWTALGEGHRTVVGYEPIRKYVVKRNRLEISIGTDFYNRGDIEVDVYAPHDVGY